jgi:hypothetical protein
MPGEADQGLIGFGRDRCDNKTAPEVAQVGSGCQGLTKVKSEPRDFVSSPRIRAELVNGDEVTATQMVRGQPVVTSEAERAIFERDHFDTPSPFDHLREDLIRETVWRRQHGREPIFAPGEVTLFFGTSDQARSICGSDDGWGSARSHFWLSASVPESEWAPAAGVASLGPFPIIWRMAVAAAATAAGAGEAAERLAV